MNIYIERDIIRVKAYKIDRLDLDQHKIEREQNMFSEMKFKLKIL